MRCTGHVTITEEAFQSIFRNCSSSDLRAVCDPRYVQSNLNQYQGNYSSDTSCFLMAARSLYAAEMVSAVDAKLWGHAFGYAQRWHFMAARGESQHQAVQNAIAYLRERVRAFVERTSAALKLNPLPKPAGPLTHLRDVYGMPRMLQSVIPYGSGVMVVPHPFAARPFFSPTELAEALHCLQDSFSPGHTTRVGGVIKEIFVYADQGDDAHHGEHDIASGTDRNNQNRKDSVQASAELIELALNAALKDDPSLSAWGDFAFKWLRSEAAQQIPELNRKASQGQESVHQWR